MHLLNNGVISYLSTTFLNNFLQFFLKRANTPQFQNFIRVTKKCKLWISESLKMSESFKLHLYFILFLFLVWFYVFSLDFGLIPSLFKYQLFTLFNVSLKIFLRHNIMIYLSDLNTFFKPIDFDFKNSKQVWLDARRH